MKRALHTGAVTAAAFAFAFACYPAINPPTAGEEVEFADAAVPDATIADASIEQQPSTATTAFRCVALPEGSGAIPEHSARSVSGP
jgi:hypothetical protein